ncbi:hypothetical protein MKW98_003844 [Papaver atlanticum]|uniref:Uncharacterized protein n=1 Tax=Papaver atlanticum TaxID=357466 RepID=A0AAD4XSD9_9MAGN|nr:hypothetical protein MKW98_003844 [Papaver atlanticum]
MPPSSIWMSRQGENRVHVEVFIFVHAPLVACYLCYLEGDSLISKVLEVYDHHIWKESQRSDASRIEEEETNPADMNPGWSHSMLDCRLGFRQRQYFEQKKRQQHSNGDDNAEGTHESAEYHRTPKSLDILSLLNLAGEAKGGNSGCNNADGPALRVSLLNYQVPKDMHKVAEIPVLRFSPVNYQLQKDTLETKSPAKEEKCASPRKKFSSYPHNIATLHKYSSNKNGDKSDCWKNATETQFSLLDLLGEDGSNGKAEGSPVRECHVAFSVEGATAIEIWAG